MALVNKFNVNKEQVTLDADIIENMSANDVSYDSSLQYDENTVGDKLSKLESETNQKIAIINSIFSLQDNPEWISVTTDKDGRIIEGITAEGKKKVMVETEIQGVNVKEILQNNMIYSKSYSPSGDVVYDTNEIPLSYTILWSDGVSGTLVNSQFNEDVFEYQTTTVTYKDISIVYTRTFDANGYVTNETITINNI